VTFDVDSTEAGDTIGFYATIAAPKLTKEILNSGDVKVYLNWGTTDDPVVDPLPLFDVYFGLSCSTVFTLDGIELYATHDLSTYVDPDLQAKIFQFRYILIPGGTTARQAIDWKDYKAVKAYLRLKD
jgi:hypothetical protein